MADSGRAFVPLLYDNLMDKGIRPFLDTINLKPGHKLFEHINKAIDSCKVGVAVLTPSYCNSHFCLHELALLHESKKRVVPIFYDIKPSQLQVKPNARYSPQLLQQFVTALEETKYTVGITFDSLNGDWTELQRKISDAVIMNVLEVEDEENRKKPAC
ncbi:hypothetical protein Fmac_009869 [Flemingia macrophylla]|uniref:TIR domain-containing protein n=1 Tax=Flemingia macrophylla TaxID=520843 RepID=A0ABD1N1F1_9FABA